MLQVSTIEGEVDWRPMVGRACVVAVLGLVVRVATIFRIGNFVNAHYLTRTWRGIPYVALVVPPEKFIVVTSSSTVAFSFFVLAVVLFAALGRQHRVRTAGWMFSAFGLFASLVVDAVLQHARYPYTDPVRMRWAVGAAALVGLITTLWFAFGESPFSSARTSQSRTIPQFTFSASYVVIGLVLVGMAFFATTGHSSPLT
jgi:hypothetical protein